MLKLGLGHSTSGLEAVLLPTRPPHNPTVFQDVAKETSATLLPFFMEQVALDPELMMKDGIHPNEKAQPIIANYMLEHVKSIWNKGTGE